MLLSIKQKLIFSAILEIFLALGENSDYSSNYPGIS